MSILNKVARLVRYDWPVHFMLSLTNWLPDNTVFLRLRGALVAPFLGASGKNLRLGRNVTLYNPERIHLGSNVYLAYGCWLMAGEQITIGDEVMFGPYCVVVSSNHASANGSFRYGPALQQPITIERGSWLAAHVVVTAGATIGAGCLLGAQSVVIGEIPDHSMAAGQPAKVLKLLTEEGNSGD